MHFVSSQSQTEQMSDIVNFLLENIHESVDPAKITPAFTDFDAKIKKLDEQRDYKGILTYLLALKSELLSLPTSHKASALTIQRAILLVLPLLKTQEKKAAKDPKTYEDLKRFTVEFSKLVEDSEYPLSIKVNS